MKRVLLIDDNELNVTLLRRRLERCGLQVDAAFSAEAGLVQARTFAPHLIILDYMLPGMNGVAAARLLRASQDTHHIPLLAMTAMDDPQARQALLAAGCTACETKPFNPDRLLALVSSLVS